MVLGGGGKIASCLVLGSARPQYSPWPVTEGHVLQGSLDWQDAAGEGEDWVSGGGSPLVIREGSIGASVGPRGAGFSLHLLMAQAAKS